MHLRDLSKPGLRDRIVEHRFVEGQIIASDLVSVLLDERPDLFFFGGANDLLALGGEMERRGLKIPLLTLRRDG